MKFIDYIGKLVHLRITNQHLQHQHFIIGNSSVDYDSFFGSLVYGYMKFLLYNVLFIPVIDCPKEEVPMRFEISYVLNRLGVKHEQLFYYSQFPDLKSRANVLLYDHNVRVGVAPAQIIDHHYMKDETCQRTIVQHCASAMTLLYYTLHPEELDRNRNQQWFAAFAKYGLSEASTHMQFDPTVDQLIRTGVLLDSSNFNPKQKARWVQQDQLAVRNIQQRLSNRQLISFETLQQIKFDEAMNCQLSLPMILQKDYKEFTYERFRIAYSIILLPPEVFQRNYGFEPIVKHEQEFLKSRSADGHFLMYLYQRKDGSYAREATLYSVDKELTERLQPILSGLKMDKSKVNTSEGLQIEHWIDPSSVISRKIIQKEISLKLLL